jgi:hypothetical protein
MRQRHLWLLTIGSIACAVAAIIVYLGPLRQPSKDGAWTRVDLEHVLATDCCGSVFVDGKSHWGMLALTAGGTVHLITDEGTLRTWRGFSDTSAPSQFVHFAAGPDIEVAAFTTAEVDRAELWVAEVSGFAPIERTETPAVDGRRSQHLVPLFDREGSFRLAGTVGRRVHVWFDGAEGWVRGDDGSALRLDGGMLLASAEEGMTFVAGKLSDRRGSRVGLWYTGGYPEAGGPDRWKRVNLPGRFDEITDLTSWEVGTWAAGRRGLTPVLWDVDNAVRDAPQRIKLPKATLDRDHPRVLLGDDYTGMVVAAQTTEGPKVWTRRPGGHTWTTWRVPNGTIMQVRLYDDRLYVVVDGDLWVRTFPRKE